MRIQMVRNYPYQVGEKALGFQLAVLIVMMTACTIYMLV